MSAFESPNHSQRSSLVLDSASMQSSGYNSPVNSGRSSLLLEEEEERDGTQHTQPFQAKLQKTHSNDTPASELSQYPLITSKRQKTTESYHN